MWCQLLRHSPALSLFSAQVQQWEGKVNQVVDWCVHAHWRAGMHTSRADSGDVQV